MKKLIIFLTLFLPIFVNAETSNASISCAPKSLITGSSFSCNVVITPNAPITSFKANVNYPSSDLELVSIEPASSWTSNSTNSIDLVNSSYNEGEGLVTETSIVTLNFKVKANSSYGNKTITISGNDLSVSKSDTVTVKSSNNLLKSLVVSGIDFAFSSNKKTYTLKTTKENITINATPYDSRASFVEGYGSRQVNLKYGNNTIQIMVQAENGNVNTYTLNVSRIDERSNNNNLSSLKVSESDLTFDKNTLTYQITVPTTKESITIDATLEDEKASFVADYGPRTVSLQNGLNTISLQVQAENGTIKTYTLNVIKSEKSSNNYLKSISLSTANINFDKNVLEYNINVLYNILEMEVTAEKEDPKAEVVVIGNKALIVGVNTYTINVTAENGAVLTYKVIVNRLEEGKELSSNNNLKELIISNYPIEFNKDILEYNIKINDEDRLTISYSTEDENARVEVIGNNELKNGDVIEIIVTSEDNNVKTYLINVEKDTFSFTIIYTAIGIFVILGLLLFLFRDKVFKKKNGEPIMKQDLKPQEDEKVSKEEKNKKVIVVEKKEKKPKKEVKKVEIPEIKINKKKRRKKVDIPEAEETIIPEEEPNEK